MYNKIYNYQDNRVHGHGLKSQGRDRDRTEGEVMEVSDGINRGFTAAIMDMDDDGALDFILNYRDVSKLTAVKVKERINKMDNCPICPDKSKSACFKCMDDYYIHMHDVDGKVMKVEVDQVRLVRHPITGKRFDPKHTMAVSL